MDEREHHDPAGEEASELEDGLINRLDVIESEPLDRRAAAFDQLTEELQAELQRGDGQ